METSPKFLLASFVMTLFLTLFMIIFVFQAVIFTFFGIILVVMLNSALFLGFVMIFWQAFIVPYPAIVNVYERRGNGLVWSIDRAKRVSTPEQGKFAFRLKNRKISTKPIDYRYIYAGSGGTNVLHLYMPQANEYVPMEIEDVAEMNKRINTTPENARYWYSEQLRRNFERWGKKFGWEKYSAFIQLALVGFIISFMLYVFLGQMQGVVQNIAGISQSQAELTKEIVKLLQVARGGVPAGVPVPSP